MPATPFSLRRIAVTAFGPSLLFGLGEGAILPVIPLSARGMGGSVAMAALVVTGIGIGSLVSNIPASLITMHRGERWAVVAYVRALQLSQGTPAVELPADVRQRLEALPASATSLPPAAPPARAPHHEEKP